MMFRFTFQDEFLANAIEQAIQNTLSKKIFTLDLAESGNQVVSTEEMGDAILAQLKLLTGDVHE
jgi:3-isopropylmalate dehydrogenase